MMSQPQQFASVGMARNRKMKKKESKKKTGFFGMGAKKNSSGSESDAEMEENVDMGGMMNECDDYGAENM